MSGIAIVVLEYVTSLLDKYESNATNMQARTTRDIYAMHIQVIAVPI